VKRFSTVICNALATARVRFRRSPNPSGLCRRCDKRSIHPSLRRLGFGKTQLQVSSNPEPTIGIDHIPSDYLTSQFALNFRFSLSEKQIHRLNDWNYENRNHFLCFFIQKFSATKSDQYAIPAFCDPSSIRFLKLKAASSRTPKNSQNSLDILKSER
jgi:hypothetical protein